MSKNQINENWAKIILVVVHIVGIAGMLSPFRAYFLMLTPINLLISFIILITVQEDKSQKFILAVILIAVFGFLIEILGVNTGFPFGDYTYGEALGPKWKGTPFMIGINWFILAYCGALLFKNATKSAYLNALLSGLTITAFDFIMEPVAIHLNFWNWSENVVPIQNYITWTVCIGLFSLLIYTLDFKKFNPISNWVLGMQVLFFTGILIGMKL